MQLDVIRFQMQTSSLNIQLVSFVCNISVIFCCENSETKVTIWDVIKRSS